ncbi:DICT sensory domain-containing protein [Halobaculum sp. D14]|uniref:DICT sensory domain-containing protein n=1 Tax=Halobaculum sp. D14 TaxID=3421642 RepID=UPI003EBB0419
MTLEQFVDEPDGPARSLVVLNRAAPDPIQTMLANAFEGTPVSVSESAVPDADDDVVVLVEDGEVLASSTLTELQNSLLLVNSDLYITGMKSLDRFELPDVLAGLDDIPFTLRGYPESNKEKLLLVLISRYIERLAWESGAGKLRSSFQRLSRINDERGTRTVYDQIADSPVDVHLYGVPDWTPPPELGVTMHGGYDEDFRDSWFVVHRTAPDRGEARNRDETRNGNAAGNDVGDDLGNAAGNAAGGDAALVALEVEPRRWRGFWTFDESLVADIDRYVQREL